MLYNLRLSFATCVSVIGLIAGNHLACGQPASTEKELPDRTEDLTIEQLNEKIKVLRSNVPAEERWTFSELRKHSDLVLIAKCQTTREIGDEILGEDFKELYETHAAKMSVMTVLRGPDSIDDEIEVLYLKMGRNTLIFRNNTNLKSLRAKLSVPVMLRVEGAGPVDSIHASDIMRDIQPVYLLFLKHRKDGFYEPASGHLQSSFSFRVIDMF